MKPRIEAAEALGQGGDPRLDPGDPARWVEIPAGTFRMGAQKDEKRKPNYDPEAFDDEAPVHDVRLDAFAISRYPVTVTEYQRFIDDGGYTSTVFWDDGGFGQFDRPTDWDEQIQFPNRPVVGVSWFEAAAWAAWARARLPTEAEWERAARGANGRRYPWGDPDPDPGRLNFSESGLGRPTPVGIYPDGATPEGVFDMAGNVWEWCQDWYKPYSGDPCENPRGPRSGTIRVLRGGSFIGYRQFVRCACRHGFNTGLRLRYIGFRVAASPGSGP